MKIVRMAIWAVALGLSVFLSACSSGGNLPEKGDYACLNAGENLPKGPEDANSASSFQPADREPATPGLPARLPVLMFHKVSHGRPDDMTVTPEKFRQVLAAIKAAGFETVLPDQWLAYVRTGAGFPEKAFMLTFDDGWKSQFEEALPIMEEFGFKGVFFIYPDFVGARKAMTWEEIARLSLKGHSIGSHSMSHGRLVNRQDLESSRDYVARLAREAGLSKKAIEARTGRPVTAFCYPYGFYSRTVMAILKRCGYDCAFTVNAQMNVPEDDPFLLGRFQVNQETPPESVVKWLGYPSCEARLLYPLEGLNLAEFPVFGRIKLGTSLMKAISEGAEITVRCHHDRPQFTLEGDILTFPIEPRIRHLNIAVTVRTPRGETYQRTFYVTCDCNHLK